VATDPIDPKEAKARLDDEIARVQAYHDAVASEFADTDPEDVDQVRKTVRATVVPKVPDFVEQLVLLATGASSESVQLNAIKYGMDLALGKMAVGDADELASLLRGITKPAPKDSEPA
jgi:2-methylisocitrate lyase-like PEP mutase family enzyme